jgi:hypothetical protein
MFILIYLAATFFCGIGAMFHYSVVTGFIILAASFLAITGTGGSILAMRSLPALNDVASVILGCGFLALAYWLADKFSIHLFGYTLSGLTWCLIGCAIGAWRGFAGRLPGEPS